MQPTGRVIAWLRLTNKATACALRVLLMKPAAIIYSHLILPVRCLNPRRPAGEVSSARQALQTPLQTPRSPSPNRQCRSISRNPRSVADGMQPKRRETTLVSSRLNDRQWFNAGARMFLVVQTNRIMSGGLHLVAERSVWKLHL